MKNIVNPFLNPYLPKKNTVHEVPVLHRIHPCPVGPHRRNPHVPACRLDSASSAVRRSARSPASSTSVPGIGGHRIWDPNDRHFDVIDIIYVVHDDILMYKHLQIYIYI